MYRSLFLACLAAGSWLAGCDKPLAVFQREGEVASSIAAGDYHTCAIFDGRVACWGRNDHGQVGVAGGDTPFPQFVEGLPLAQRISGGEFFTCALTVDGEVYCWGDNATGQLGDGTTQSSASPVGPVPLPGTARAIGVGATHACAVLSDGALYCWGGNRARQVADDEAQAILVPRRVGAHTYRQVEGGSFHTCAIRDDARLLCWGQNAHTKLGLGRDEVVIAEPSVVADVAWSDVDLGQEHTCALRDGDVYCWGNDARYIGNDMGIPNMLVASTLTIDAGDFVDVSVGWFHSCARRADGTAQCLGRNEEGQIRSGAGQVVEATEIDGDWAAIAVGIFHTCGIQSTGQAVCRGENSHGQLGTGDFARRSEPTPIAPP